MGSDVDLPVFVYLSWVRIGVPWLLMMPWLTIHRYMGSGKCIIYYLPFIIICKTYEICFC